MASTARFPTTGGASKPSLDDFRGSSLCHEDSQPIFLAQVPVGAPHLVKNAEVRALSTSDATLREPAGLPNYRPQVFAEDGGVCSGMLL